MKHDAETLPLRMELLRTRAALERAEVAAAMDDLRDGTRRLRSLAAVASNLGAAVSGGGRSLFATAAGAVTGRPWLAALALGALRAVRRHPWLALAAAGTLAVGIIVARGRSDPETQAGSG